MLLWKTSAVTGVPVYLLVTSMGLGSTHSHLGSYVQVLKFLRHDHQMLRLSLLMWSLNMELDDQQRSIKVTEEIDSRAFCIVWSLMWSSHRNSLFRQGLALIFLRGSWRSVKPAPRHTSGCGAWRFPSQQAGTGDGLEKLLRAGAEQKTHTMGCQCCAAVKSTNTEILHDS